MKLDKKTIAVLSNFSSINPSIQVKPGNRLRTVSKGKTIFAEATIDNAFDTGFCIFDLGRFLSSVSIFDEPEIEVLDGSLVLKEGPNKITYATADEKTLIVPKDNTVDFGDVYVSFEVTAPVIQQAFKAASILKLRYIRIFARDGKILVQAFDKTGRISDTHEQEIGETDKDFNLMFNLDNLLIMTSNYQVNVHKIQLAPDKTLLLAKFLSQGEQALEYVIALEAESVF
jgi:hypothetical protein